MSYQVRDLAGKHLGKTITITTANTTATGVLQSIQCIGEAYSDRDFDGITYYLGGHPDVTIALLPDQEIKAKMIDAVEIEGAE